MEKGAFQMGRTIKRGFYFITSFFNEERGSRNQGKM